jgi:Holliday junction DNA helicase RuvA
MISSLHGRVESLVSDGAVINVGGIGFQVYMPTSTLSALGGTGKEVQLYTHLHLREDNAALYGFASVEELTLFQTLLGVAGLGPKLALAMLSAMSAEQLTMSIATGSTELLTAIPGIGKKVANRIVLELKEKIGAGWVTTPAPEIALENTEVLGALTSLGYTAAEAAGAVTALPASTDLSLEDKI